MNRPRTDHFTLVVLTISFVTCAIWGGRTFSQTQPGDTPAPSSTVQEEPGTSEEQGEVIERGILRRDNRRLPGLHLPKTTAPSSPAPKTLIPSTGGLSPSGTLTINAPTPSLTAVVNAIQIKHKSLTTLISLPPNLPVTQPVELSIGYFSPAGSYAPGTQRITQSYVRGTGNHFLNNDPEGDGKPRQMRVDITLRELQPGGQSFSVSRPINLDPLYDVTISPLDFTLLKKCDLVGKSEISFRWYSPDDQFHSLGFSIKPSNTFHIRDFAWARNEISLSANLHLPFMYFYEKDPGYPFQPDPLHGNKNLVPGKTKTVSGIIQEGIGPPGHIGQCYGDAKYTITYTLRWYADL